ncbi:MAG: rod shape-determining protein RodA [Alphaproteobacteria bacterium]|nr:rod shape-determining protein RodA [Alphaproteobacteria bacterium]
MILRIFQMLYRLPWLLLISVAALVVVGTLALYSASEGAWSPWAERQMIRAGIGAMLLVVVALMPTIWLHRLSYWGLAMAVALLLVLPFIGTGTGATRWIEVGLFNFQPSEPAKLAVIIALARYLSSQTPEQVQSLISYLPVIFMLGVPFALVLIQPDLGTSFMLLTGGLAVVFAAGVPRRFVVTGIMLAAAAAPVLWSQLYDYQKARIMTFLNPEADVLGAGYQITQSKIALGSGGLFGKGFLQGSQSQLNYLPEKQTDFVFTMIGEEFGFIGNLGILLIYFTILASVMLTGLRCQHRFGRLACMGISFMIFLYIFVNIGMVTGLLPVVGAPLPLISYGGTAMLTVFIALGVVVNISIYKKVQDSDFY